MAAFATPEELQARWRSLSGTEITTARALLDDASAIARGEFPGIDARLEADPPTLDAALPRMVVCGMVKRAMIAGVDVEGVTTTQQTAGPYAQSQTFANPMGNLYLTKADRRVLSARGRAFMVDLAPEDAGSLWAESDQWS